MKRLVWATDPHLGHAGADRATEFIEALATTEGDWVVLTGDIGTASNLDVWLTRLSREVGKPIYFVLGNHDFYGGSTSAIRDRVTRLCVEEQGLTYLWNSPPISLSEKTALVGTDGWGDARYGNWRSTSVEINDFSLIKDLKWCVARPLLIDKLRAFGDESAARLRRRLAEALSSHETVIVATHVPPFCEAAWAGNGRRTDDDWMPFFACKAVGDVLLEAASAHPDKQILVLCGHTHGSSDVMMRPNLRVLTGGVRYGSPAIQQTIEIP